jgi:hypothetical protein
MPAVIAANFASDSFLALAVSRPWWTLALAIAVACLIWAAYRREARRLESPPWPKETRSGLWRRLGRRVGARVEKREAGNANSED